MIETHFAFEGVESHTWNGNTYLGDSVPEHDLNSKPDELAKAVWSSLDNPKSFWFTRPSLYNLVRQVGFSSVYECLSPVNTWVRNDKQYLWRDRVTLVAIKGQRQRLLASPVTDASPDWKYPEKPEYFVPSDNFLPGKQPGWWKAGENRQSLVVRALRKIKRVFSG